MLAADCVSEMFAHVRGTIFRYIRRLTATDVLVLVIVALILLGLYEVVSNNIDSLASGADATLTPPSSGSVPAP